MIKKIAYFILILILTNLPVHSELKWNLFGNLNIPRQMHSAVAISDSEILVIGGLDNTFGNGILKSCEIINVSKGTIVFGPEMNYERSYFCTLVTRDTSIIVISGCTNGYDYLTPTIEMFERQTRKWKYLGNLIVARWQHTAEFINEHEILVVGGRDAYAGALSSAEIFDINTGNSRIVKDYSYDISDGVTGNTSTDKLVVFGGRSGGTNSYRSKYIYQYDLISNSWLLYDSLEKAVQIPVMIRLNDKRLIMIGGAYSEAPLDFSNYIYIENNGKFNHVGNMLINRIRFTISQFNDDSILIIGGYRDNVSNTSSCDWFNSKTYKTTVGPSLNYSRNTFVTVPIKLPLYQSNTIFTIGGRDNNWNSITSVEVLFDSIKSTPPKISSIKYDCNNYYITASDSNFIDKIELTGANNNVMLYIVDSLPSKLVNIIVSLIDPSKDGFFTVTFYCYRTGECIKYSGTIYNRPSNLIVLDPLDNGEIQVGNTTSGKLKCIKITLQNPGSQDLVLDEAMLLRNIEFSIPQGQLPLTITAGEKSEIEICYLPSKLGLQYDTLYLTGLCDSLKIPVKATTDTSYYYGMSECDIPVNMKTFIPAKLLFLKTPFPNPGNDIVFVNLGVTTKASIKCNLIDFNGDLAREGIASETIMKSEDGLEWVEKEYTLELSGLSNGMYFIVVETLDEKRVFPYFVIH